MEPPRPSSPSSPSSSSSLTAGPLASVSAFATGSAARLPSSEPLGRRTTASTTARTTPSPAMRKRRFIPDAGSDDHRDGASNPLASSLVGGFKAVHLEEIEEVSDGRAPWRPVRHHLGIKAFGINAWTAREAGDRIINEHDEADTEAEAEGQQEELYFVQEGRARFELDGEGVAGTAGHFR